MVKLKPFLEWLPRIWRARSAPVRRKLRTRLLVTLIPTSLIVLALMGYATYWASSEFISLALERNSRIHAVTTAYAVEALLERCKRNLLFAARNPMNAEGAAAYLKDLRELEGLEFAEFGFMPLREGEPVVFVSREGESRRLAQEEVDGIRPGPALLYEHVRELKAGEVWLSEFGEVETPYPSAENPRERVSRVALRMVTPYVGPAGELGGYAYLSLNVQVIRNVLSLYESSNSPVFAFPRNPKFQRYTFFFDVDGWALFQSESELDDDSPLRTLNIRKTLSGTLGRPGLPEAFRPSERNENYWRTVEDVRKGHKDIVRPLKRMDSSSPYSEHFLAYAPVRLGLAPGQDAAVIGGIAYEDRSVLVDLAGYRHIDVMLIISAISVLVLVLAIALVARGTTLGLQELAYAVKNLTEKGEWEEVRLVETGYEAEMLKDSINSMIRTLQAQFEEIKSKDLKIESVTLKEPVELSMGPAASTLDESFPELVGAGPFMKQMKRDIVKASQVEVDVLIEGETGTGKQLAAEAVHRLSSRSGKPFISINCGELDENLLLDSLFGHVKGAFTDGKGDRRGAFLQADGGTLFLDEIQSASLKVQQALLRALSLRKIKPLGSDQDVDVNVRLITATNVDLKALIGAGKFREDLYYRLKVITITTPSLREQRQNIPLLAMHFLKEGEHMAGRTGLALSRGALKALISYDWPGNIRELKHVIITAAVMSEGRVIQSEQLGINGKARNEDEGQDESADSFARENGEGFENSMPAKYDNAQNDGGLPLDLNSRQVIACEYVRAHGSISSKDLLGLLDGGISKRTASYDLQDLVNRGLLTRVGQGPATRYVRPANNGRS
ncbi:sigma 54-interacting transcriptional regulator [Desulfomicrobium sp. ZS1]|jgi:transcriptional regulator with GAF, ATPase, and Fis domain|uniref:sigma 54-interacting transcriptional regulator n=1 Tax=Desulfomicrobium sp. ZS1 TaxID=2952228 RepID=UPI0020B41350|nr:sigma 54-interacting transcriptional regulator [Desulfomicrobium sp. ZS1]UTF50844.1 sigma 54-interacting transcriptional regulator [Desulfomicrobium sp. ZS1]